MLYFILYYAKKQNYKEENHHRKTINSAISLPFFISNRNDCISHVHTLLHHFICTDGSTYQCCSQRYLMVHLLRIGKDLPIWWLVHPRSGRSETTEKDVQKKEVNASIFCFERESSQIIRKFFVNFTSSALRVLNIKGGMLINRLSQ